MGAELVIHTLEELKAFLNDNGILEIAMRNQKKRFKNFEKVIIDVAQNGQEKELADKVIQALNKNNLLNQKNLKLLGNIAQMQQLGLLLNGLNLCATCAGFAIMYAKLDKMSSEINKQINQVRKEMKDINDLHAEHEFNKVLSEHTDMLDCEKKQQPYSEEKLRQLVDAEYNVLTLLISTLQKDVAGDHEALIFSIYSMLTMLTVSLRKFDEIYYFNNRAALENQDPWHLSHSKWMSVYEKLSSDWCVEKLQDIATFDMDLTTDQVDAYYPEPMEEFLNSNPGLKSRFSKNIMFEDYSDVELLSIFQAFCKPYEMTLAPDAQRAVTNYLQWLVQHKSTNFANGREMRNLFEAALANQANRLATLTEITNDELNEISPEDLPAYVLDAPIAPANPDLI